MMAFIPLPAGRVSFSYGIGAPAHRGSSRAHQALERTWGAAAIDRNRSWKTSLPSRPSRRVADRRIRRPAPGVERAHRRHQRHPRRAAPARPRRDRLAPRLPGRTVHRPAGLRRLRRCLCRPSTLTAPIWLLIIAGLIVGFGTRLGAGCTSGHGVCGIGRGSPRSLVATPSSWRPPSSPSSSPVTSWDAEPCR